MEHAELQLAVKKAQDIAYRAAMMVPWDRSKRYEKLFKTFDFDIRSKVAHRFRHIANEADASAAESKATWLCSDFDNACNPNVVAYPSPDDNAIGTCAAFWGLRTVAIDCFERTRAGTVVHELSHVPAVISLHCVDHAHGLDNSLKLTKEQAWMNADTYMFYAESLKMGCDIP